MLCRESRSSPMSSVGVPLLNPCLGLGTRRAMGSCIKKRSFSDTAVLRGVGVPGRMHAFVPLQPRGPQGSLRPSLLSVMDNLGLVTLKMLGEDTQMTSDPNS